MSQATVLIESLEVQVKALEGNRLQPAINRIVQELKNEVAFLVTGEYPGVKDVSATPPAPEPVKESYPVIGEPTPVPQPAPAE